MLTLKQKKLHKELMKQYGWDIAKAKQGAVSLGEDDDGFLTLTLLNLCNNVVNAVNEFAAAHDGDTTRLAEGIAATVQTGLNALKELHKQDPEVALRLGVVIQAELENALSGDIHDGTEDRSRG
jgi:hypothetical protein